MTVPATEAKYPAVHPAFSIAIASYDLAVKRWDAWEGRIQTLLAFVTAIGLGVPAVIHNSLAQAKFSSSWFILALLAFLAAVVIGIYARFIKGLHVVDPKRLYNGWLHFSDWEFKKNYIYFAGEHFDLNMKAIGVKRKLAFWMLACFLIGIICLTIWAIRAMP